MKYQLRITPEEPGNAGDASTLWGMIVGLIGPVRRIGSTELRFNLDGKFDGNSHVTEVEIINKP